MLTKVGCSSPQTFWLGRFERLGSGTLFGEIPGSIRPEARAWVKKRLTHFEYPCIIVALVQTVRLPNAKVASLEDNLRIFTLLIFMTTGVSALAQNYQLGPSDLLKISVIELEDLAGEYRVDSQGNLSLPYLGQFSVFHLTVSELRSELAKQLTDQDLVNEPQVLIDLLEINYRPINVIGAVNNPGKLTKVFQNINLVDAITRAGGLQDNAGDTILIMRTSTTGFTETLKVSYRELLIQGKAFLNIPIFAGDTINVPIEKPMYISVLGEVNKPGEFDFKSTARVTLLRVIASAGGFTDFAKRHKVAVRRDGKEIKVDVRAIQEEGKADFVMQDGDIVSVP